jgi:nucleoside-triphosphatase THEP1
MFGVSQKVLVTGRPGCGKTTLIKRVLDELPQRFGGFYTGEIRDHGTRVGFKVVALEGGEAVNDALDSELPVLATIFSRSLPFTDGIKSRPDVALVEVSPNNRDRLVSQLSEKFRT